MRSLIMNTVVSGMVAAATVVAMHERHPTSPGDTGSRPSSLTSSVAAGPERLEKAVGQLVHTQARMDSRLTKLDRAFQALGTSVQNVAGDLRNEMAQLRDGNFDTMASLNAEQGIQTVDSIAELEDKSATDKETPDPWEQVTAMDSAFLDQEADRTWDDTARETIYDNYLASESEGIALQDLSCVGAMCRLEILQEPGVDLTEASVGGPPLVPWDHRSRASIIENPDGSMTTFLYVSRQGYDLPEFE